MSLPEHVTETVATTSTYRCTVCRARVIFGDHDKARVDQLLAEWVTRHRHGVTEEHDTNPTEKEPS